MDSLAALSAASPDEWSALTCHYEQQTLLVATVRHRNAGGYVVEMAGLGRAFLPGSHSGVAMHMVPPEQDPLVGFSTEVVIIALPGALGGRPIVSRTRAWPLIKALIKAEVQRLALGAEVEVRVLFEVASGVVAQVGRVRGLIRPAHYGYGVPPPAPPPVGAVVRVRVSRLDIKETNQPRVEFSIRQALPDPMETALDRYPVGTRAQATVATLVNFGLFVELEAGVPALLHRHQIATLPADARLTDYFRVGDVLPVTVITVDHARRRMAVQYEPPQPLSPRSERN